MGSPPPLPVALSPCPWTDPQLTLTGPAAGGCPGAYYEIMMPLNGPQLPVTGPQCPWPGLAPSVAA